MSYDFFLSEPITKEDNTLSFNVANGNAAFLLELSGSTPDEFFFGSMTAQQAFYAAIHILHNVSSLSTQDNIVTGKAGVTVIQCGRSESLLLRYAERLFSLAWRAQQLDCTIQYG